MRFMIIILSGLSVVGCSGTSTVPAAVQDTKTVARQQSQYSIAQPVPMYDYSLERDLVIQLYNLRNSEIATHSVWRADLGTIEGDCPSMGYGLPYDTSLTNPWVATDQDVQGHKHTAQGGALASISQPEPNGIFASTNTSATWVMCVGDGGRLEPHYIEAKVTVYPGPVEVDYTENRVYRDGQASATIKPVKTP